MKQRSYTLIICCSILFICGFISLGFLQYQSSKKEIVVPLTYNWSYSLNGKSSVSLCLPTHVSSYFHKGDVVDLYTTLPGTRIPTPHLRTKIFLQNVKIFLDNQLIYAYDGDTNSEGDKEVGSGILVLPLPGDYAYKTLHIQYVHNFNHITNYIFPIILTEKNLQETLLFDSAETLYLNGCFLLTGIICVLIGFGRKYKKRSWLSFLFLGLFATIYATWSLCNTKIVQLFIPNLTTIHHLEYISFYSATIPLWLFFYTIVKQRILKIYCLVGMVPSITFFTIAIALHSMRAINLFELLPIYHGLLMSNLFLMIVFILILIYKKHPLSKGLLLGMLCLGLCCLLEIVKFYAHNIKVTSFVNYGIVLFYIHLIYALCHPQKAKESSSSL